MGRIQLELIYFYYLFFIVVPFNSCVFFPVGLSSLTRLFPQVLLGVEVSFQARGQENSTPQQDLLPTGKKTQLLNGTTVKNR
jgi:hypothetical protein